jgi:hypothetical protein
MTDNDVQKLIEAMKPVFTTKEEKAFPTAEMVRHGFEESAKNLEALHTDMNQRFDRVENLLLADHKRRIETPEKEVKDLKEALAM